MRHKSDLDTLSMDDLYNNLKVYEADIKGQSSSSSNSQNVAFVTSDNTSSTNEAVNTAHDVSAASSQGQAPSSTYVDDVMFSFFANQSNSPTFRVMLFSIPHDGNPSRVNIKQLCGKDFCHNNIKNDLRKLKGKDIVDNAAQVSNATTIAPGMYKLDPVTLAPKDKNNKETHIYYLKHTMEQVGILREIVEQAK
ncbi:hypothetical protein Tco_0700597 [Tanacetum coccineum]